MVGDEGKARGLAGLPKAIERLDAQLGETEAEEGTALSPAALREQVAARLAALRS